MPCSVSSRSSTVRFTSRSGSVSSATSPPSSRDAIRSSRPTSVLGGVGAVNTSWRSEEHTSELQSRLHLVCRLLLEKKKKTTATETGQKTTRRPSLTHKTTHDTATATTAPCDRIQGVDVYASSCTARAL